MYQPKDFEEKRIEEIHRVISEHPLGVLVMHGRNGLDANHLPFALDPETGERGHLLAHVARANPVWKESHDGDEALVIFRAANAQPGSIETILDSSNESRDKHTYFKRCLSVF